MPQKSSSTIVPQKSSSTVLHIVYTCNNVFLFCLKELPPQSDLTEHRLVFSMGYTRCCRMEAGMGGMQRDVIWYFHRKAVQV